MSPTGRFDDRAVQAAVPDSDRRLVVGLNGDDRGGDRAGHAVVVRFMFGAGEAGGCTRTPRADSRWFTGPASGAG